MKRLVIAEKGSSAKKIATILSGGTQRTEKIERVSIHHFEVDGDRYTVLGLRGHIVNWDYPQMLASWSKVKPLELVWAEPEKVVTEEPIVDLLKKHARGADEVLIATDYDREGELIGVEALEIVQSVNPDVQVHRVRFSALTPTEVSAAFGDPKEVDYALARSAESRQIVDLAWGATLTRLITTSARQRGTNYLSIGRVQSPTLALIVEREEKVEAFVPKPFWTLTASFRKGETFLGEHQAGRFWKREEAEAILQALSGAETGTVEKYAEREKQDRPPTPFNTTAFLTEATKIGFTAYQAMSVAEDLYNGGLISYPRTDNTVYPRSLPLGPLLESLLESDLREEAREILAQDRLTPTRGKREETDHPPIHPVAAATKRQLKGNKWRVYELVVRRFLATLAPPSQVKVSKATLEVRGEAFRSQGTRLLASGWRKYYPYRPLKEVLLPVLAEGESVPLLGVEMAEGETKPPARYSQGTLIQEMEKQGLGTKATRHEIIKKLYDRRYILGSSLQPTPSGRALIQALQGHAEEITRPDMTAMLETEMYLVAQGEKQLRDVVNESRELLHHSVNSLVENRQEVGEGLREALRAQRVLGPCPESDHQLVLRFARGRRPFVGCEGYPDCRVTFSLPFRGTISPTEEVCASCGVPLVHVTLGRRSETHCINPACEVFRESNRVATCPTCGGDLLIRISRNNKRFAGCSNYPTCRTTYPLPQRGALRALDTPCETCGSPMIQVLAGRRPWTTCINMDCPSKERKGDPSPQAAKGV